MINSLFQSNSLIRPLNRFFFSLLKQNMITWALKASYQKLKYPEKRSQSSMLGYNKLIYDLKVFEDSGHFVFLDLLKLFLNSEKSDCVCCRVCVINNSIQLLNLSNIY